SAPPPDLLPPDTRRPTFHLLPWLIRRTATADYLLRTPVQVSPAVHSPVARASTVVIESDQVLAKDKIWQCARASWSEPKRAGNVGRYFSVLNCASENGLSFETCGRARVLVRLRSGSTRATGLEVIAGRRAA